MLCDRYIESSLVLQRFDGVDPTTSFAINAGIPRPGYGSSSCGRRPNVLADRLAQRPTAARAAFERGIGPERELELYAEADPC